MKGMFLIGFGAMLAYAMYGAVGVIVLGCFVFLCSAKT